jgi:hypothetical protein
MSFPDIFRHPSVRVSVRYPFAALEPQDIVEFANNSILIVRIRRSDEASIEVFCLSLKKDRILCLIIFQWIGALIAPLSNAIAILNIRAYFPLFLFRSGL